MKEKKIMLSVELDGGKSIVKLKEFEVLIKIKDKIQNSSGFKSCEKKSIVLNGLKFPKWDSIGVVIDVGREVSLFHVGEEVFYARDINKKGSSAEYQIIDEHIIGKIKNEISISKKNKIVPLKNSSIWEMLWWTIRIWFIL